MKPKQAPKPNKPTKSPAPTQTPAPAADPAAERQQQLESARRKLNDLMGYGGSFARAERGLTAAKAMLLAAEAVMNYRQDQLIAMTQGSAQPEAPWLKAIADSPLGRSFAQEYSRVGATDDDLIEFFRRFVENGDLRQHLDCGDYQFDLASDNATPLLMLASGRYNFDAIATGDELIADIREALKIPQPRSSPTKPGQTKPGKAPKSPASVEAPKPAASKPKAIRKADKSAEMAALAKTAKPAGSSKPPRLTYADYQYKLAWRADGHTRSKVTSPGQFDRTSEGRDDAIRYLLTTAKLPPTTAIDDRTGITRDAVESPPTPATDSTTTATDPIAPATDSATQAMIDAAESDPSLSDPDDLPPAPRHRDLPDGYYLYGHGDGWSIDLIADKFATERYVITREAVSVEDAIRAAAKVLGIEARLIRVLDEDGKTVLDGTGADLLKAEESLPT